MEIRSHSDPISPPISHSVAHPISHGEAQTLYEGCCSRDPVVCEAAFQRLGGFLLRVARYQAQSQANFEQTAKDCTQQALFTIWQKLTAGQGPQRIEGFLSWCASIVIHKTLDELRKIGRTRTVSLDEQLESDDPWVTQLPDLATPTPERYTIDRGVKAELVDLIQNHGQLSDEAKIVLLYGYLLDWSDEELAQFLDKQRVTIRVLRSRGLKTLREDQAFMHSISFLVSFDVESDETEGEDDAGGM